MPTRQFPSKTTSRRRSWSNASVSTSELRNLTVLIGNGCSIPNGAPLIHDTSTVVNEFDTKPYRLIDNDAHRRARKTLNHFLASKGTIGVEPLLSILNNVRATSQLLGTSQTIGNRTVTEEDAASLERLLKKWLYLRCKALSSVADDALRYHAEFFRRILLRSTTLPRAKVFTTNYDLLLERALDNLGVLYFDGFLGTIDRTLRTESYHYDLYYPGETTEGRVSRVDRGSAPLQDAREHQLAATHHRRARRPSSATYNAGRSGVR